MISKGYVYHLVRVKDSILEIPTLDLFPVACEFPEMFQEDLPKVPPEREIDFGIDILQIPSLFLFLLRVWLKKSLRN